MNKFKEQLRIIEEALLKPMSDDHAYNLDKEKLKFVIDDIKRRASLNEDGTYDVEGDVDLHAMNLIKLPMKFGKVSGDFLCDTNQLTTLDGSPIKVEEMFNCEGNKLTSLEGCPKFVGRGFNCGYNNLTSLEEGPKEVGGYFYCSNNPIKFTEDAVRSACTVYGDIET